MNVVCLHPVLRQLANQIAAFQIRCYSSALSQVNGPLQFINGQRVELQSPEAGEDFDLINPATGAVLRQVQSAGQADVDNVITSARAAFPAWAGLTGLDRGKLLRHAADLVRTRLEDIAQMEVLDTGKPIWEARLDIEGCADTMEYYAGLAPTITGTHLPLSGGSFMYTRREPLGVVGGIGAWNYPFQMASWKSAPALACGNTMIFKPSELTPLTALMLADIYMDVGVPAGVFNVIQGQGKTGQWLSNHSGIDKMSFTGSIPTGSKIMAACSKGIKHVTLELGGKSPLIVFADADIDNAVKGTMLANFMTQGEVCSNGTRVFVEKSIMGDFLEQLVRRTKGMKIGNPTKKETSVGAMISKAHAEKVMGYIDLAKKEGATILYGGERVIPDDPSLAGGYYLRPCILVDCHDDMTVVKEEIFGSVVTVMGFDTEDEVVRRANDTEFGLAGGVFTRDIQRAHRVVARLEAGSIYVNNYNIYYPGIPFGGNKMSGIGRENGPDTVNYYTQVKSVYVEMNDVDCPW